MILKIIEALIALPKLAKFLERLYIGLATAFRKKEANKRRRAVERAKIASKKARTKKQKRAAALQWRDAIRGKR